MKPLTIYITGIIVVFIGLGILLVGLMEQSKYSELQEKQIQHLQEQNQAQRDSLEKELKLTKDSLNIALNTILLKHEETLEAHERSQRTIDNLRKIIFITHTDSSRTEILKQLYPTFKPN